MTLQRTKARARAARGGAAEAQVSARSRAYFRLCGGAGGFCGARA